MFHTNRFRLLKTATYFKRVFVFTDCRQNKTFRISSVQNRFVKTTLKSSNKKKQLKNTKPEKFENSAVCFISTVRPRVHNNLACVAWRFLSNSSALAKRRSRDNEHQSREEPGRFDARSLLCALAFKLLKPTSYAG